MNKTILGILSLLLVGQPAVAEPFVFDWPDDATATVESRVEHGPDTSVMQYDIRLRRVSGAGDFDLEFTNVALVSINGQPANTPEVQAQMGPMRGLLTVLLTLVINKMGHYRDISGIEALSDELLKFMPDEMDLDMRLRFGEFFRSPAMQAKLRARGGDLWNAWVGSWVGHDLSIGETSAGMVPINLAGREIEQAVSVDNLGYDSEYPSAIRLRLVTTTESPALVVSSNPMVRTMATQLARSETYAIEDFKSVKMTTVIEAVVEPSTLKPQIVERINQVVITHNEGRYDRDSEKSRYVFTWK